MRHTQARMGVLAILVVTVATACTSTEVASPGHEVSSARLTAATSGSPSSRPPSGDAAEATPSDAPSETSTPTSADDSTPDPLPGSFRAAAASRTIRILAGDIGPREAGSADFRTAARWVQQRFERLGYEVHRQPLRVPAGTSWGIAVPKGRTWNVVATLGSPRPSRPHLVVGAHLDTVPQAPGAEDNASGVGVVLAVASAAAVGRTRLPVVFVAFGAEEPRGLGDDAHHFGSRAYVASLRPAERRTVRAMVSLDRVGVGERVPVGSAGETDPVQSSLLAAARRADVPTVAEGEQRSSDHWSFVRAGLPGARLGSTPYAGYHGPGDVPAVVSPAQLERVGRLLLAWLAPRQVSP